MVFFLKASKCIIFVNIIEMVNPVKNRVRYGV